ncbi:MAG TPA: hypothetical protein VMZ50_12550 [Phycisphaerae bacterium]|nr:hypothetical protein [Phycisphaerae bacterium]
MQYDYAWEKFYSATVSLARGLGTCKERLMTALLSLQTLQREGFPDLPPAIRERFGAFSKKVEFAQPTADEGTWQASINAMTDLQAVECIEEIVSMYDAVTRYQEPLD